MQKQQNSAKVFVSEGNGWRPKNLNSQHSQPQAINQRGSNLVARAISEEDLERFAEASAAFLPDPPAETSQAEYTILKEYDLAKDLFGVYRLQVTTRNNQPFVNIARFYQVRETGYYSPTRKQIWLPVEAWRGLCLRIGAVNQELKKQLNGQSIFGGASRASSSAGGGGSSSNSSGICIDGGAGGIGAIKYSSNSCSSSTASTFGGFGFGNTPPRKGLNIFHWILTLERVIRAFPNHPLYSYIVLLQSEALIYLLGALKLLAAKPPPVPERAKPGKRLQQPNDGPTVSSSIVTVGNTNTVKPGC